MLKSISVKRFQSHNNTTLDLCDGVNVVVGASDCGKTAILRALRFAIWNRPGGDAFRSSFSEKDTEVIITTKEGDVITRTKGKDNSYKLNDLEFRAFGTEIPAEISQCLNLQEINLQKQFDQPFLLTSTAGEVASHWNAVAHLELIDISIKKVQSWIRELTDDCKAEDKQILKLTEDLAAYEGLEQMEVDLEVLEGMDQDLTKLYNTQSKLTKLTQEIQTVEADIEETSTILRMEPDVDAILKLYEAKESDLKAFTALTLLLTTEGEITSKIASKQAVIALEGAADSLLSDIRVLEGLETDLNSIQTLISKAEKIENKITEYSKIIALETLLQPILDLYEEQEKVEKQNYELTILIEKMNVIENNIKVLTTIQIPKLQAQFDKEMGSECLLCGQPIKNHKH